MSAPGIGEISQQFTDIRRRRRRWANRSPSRASTASRRWRTGWSFRVQMRLDRQQDLAGLLQKLTSLGRAPRAHIQVELTVHAAGQNIIRYGSATGPDEGARSIKLLEEAALAEAILTLRRKM